jgi:hypothetical protein
MSCRFVWFLFARRRLSRPQRDTGDLASDAVCFVGVYGSGRPDLARLVQAKPMAFDGLDPLGLDGGVDFFKGRPVLVRAVVVHVLPFVS